MTIEKKEMQNIRTLYDELMDQQNLEFVISSDTGIIDTTITKYAGYPSLYKSSERMSSLVSKLDSILVTYSKKASKQGQLQSEDALKRFMSNQERISRNAKDITLIKQLSKRKAEQRLRIYVEKLGSESKYVENQINSFVTMQRNMGRKAKDIIIDLVAAGKDKSGFMQGFNKKVKQIATIATRTERGQAEYDNYKLYTKPQELWQWITVSTSPCTGCKARAGRILSYRKWRSIGLPRAGSTICNGFCLCRLYPVSIAKDKFPTVKEFRWNSKDLVLTSPSVEKLLIKGGR